MEQGENYTKEAWAALSPELQVEALRIEKAVRDFLADSRATRYDVTEANGEALQKFLVDHNLEINHPNLLFAYNSLSADGTLELIPLAAPAPAPSQPPAPIPTAPDPRAPQMFRNGRPIAFTNPRPL